MPSLLVADMMFILIWTLPYSLLILTTTVDVSSAVKPSEDPYVICLIVLGLLADHVPLVMLALLFHACAPQQAAAARKTFSDPPPLRVLSFLVVGFMIDPIIRGSRAPRFELVGEMLDAVGVLKYARGCLVYLAYVLPDISWLCVRVHVKVRGAFWAARYLWAFAHETYKMMVVADDE